MVQNFTGSPSPKHCPRITNQSADDSDNRANDSQEIMYVSITWTRIYLAESPLLPGKRQSLNHTRAAGSLKQPKMI